MKKFLFFLSFLSLGYLGLDAQTAFYCENCNVTMRDGVTLYIEGDYENNSSSANLQFVSTNESFIEITGDIVHNGTSPLFKPGDRSVFGFRGQSLQRIRGNSTGATNFYSIGLLGGSDMILDRDISLNHEFQFSGPFVAGNLNLNGHNLQLEIDPTNGVQLLGNNGGTDDPVLMGETIDTRIFGTSGSITLQEMIATGYLNTSRNLGNIGLEIEEPGMTQIELQRKQMVNSINSTNSIQRHYDVFSTNNTPGANIKFHYLDGGAHTDILPGTAEEDLVFFKRNITSLGTLEGGAPWLNDSLANIDVVNDVATNNNIENLTNERFTLVECQAPAVSVSASQDSVCLNTAVTIDAGAGTGWTYMWSNRETTQTITVTRNFQVTEKFYVIVNDDRGCFARDSVTISWLDFPEVSFPVANETVCEGATLTLNPIVMGDELSYFWSTGETTSTIDHVSNGIQSINYAVTVTSYDRCETAASLQVDDVLNPVVDLGEDIVECDGAPQTIVAGPPTTGTGPFYEWRDVDENIISTQNQISVSETGYYAVVVTNLEGCSTFDDIFVTISNIQLSQSFTSIGCNGGATNINLDIQGLMNDFEVLWSDGSQTVNLNGATAGTYSVTVTEVGGCKDSIKNIIVTEPPAITTAPIITHDFCGDGSGSIISNISGGTLPYLIIEWYDNSQQQQPGPFATTPDVSGLSFGMYNLSVIDDNSCQYDTIIEILGGPIVPSYTTQQTDISCPGAEDGSLAIVGLSGGNPPYDYIWSNGATTASISGLEAGNYSVTATDVNGCFMLDESFTLLEAEDAIISLESLENVTCNGEASGAIEISVDYSGQYSVLWSTGANTEAIGGRPVGMYSVTVTFGNSCENVETYELTEPEVLMDSPVINNDLCSDGEGSISTNVMGGTGTFTYMWSTGDETPDIAGLEQGNYSVTVTDENNCSVTRSYQVSRIPTLTLSEEHTDEQCAGEGGGTAEIFHTGGTLPHTYTWSHGATGRVLNDLEPGSYTATVTDANGCTAEIDVTIDEATALDAQASITDASSTEDEDGEIDLTVAGGQEPYAYLWSQGSTTEDLTGLSQGVYDITVVDANGCASEFSFVVSAPTIINTEASVAGPLCNGDNTGAIDLTLSGGNEPYTFLWSNGSSQEDIAGLLAGDYTVTIMDSDGITAFGAFTVEEPEALSLVLDKADVSCNAEMDGSIEAQADGGTGILTYSWSNGSDSPLLNNLEAGIYTLTLTDEKGCATSESIEVEEPLPISLLVSSTNVSAEGASDGTASADVSGGTEPYSYLWSNGEISPSIIGVAGGEYSVTVTDNNNCTESGMVSVLDPSAVMVSGEVSGLLCFGDQDGNIDLIIEGGNAPYSYTWSNGDATEDISGLGAGIYVVTVTDGDGLMVTSSFMIAAPEEIMMDEVELMNVDCGGSTGSINVTASGGTGELSYSWSSGETTSSISEKPAGMYSLSITDENDCSAMFMYEIAANSDLEIVTQVMDASCGENFDGEIDITVSGGEAPYTYMWSTGQISEDLVNLGPGEYVVTVTDANMCSSVANAEVLGGSGFTLSGEVVDVSCFSANDGSVAISVQGGGEDFTYQWSNGAITSEISDLTDGTYSVTVTDENGCSASSTFVVLEPGAISLNLNSSLAGCSSENDGSISVAISGGQGPYSYAWSTGASGQTISGLSPGEYSVTVTDSNGCTADIATLVSETDQMLEARFLVASPVRETETLQFLDLSFPKPNSWLYRFGNPKNSTSTEEDPLFRYPNNPDEDESTYMATLIVSSVACIDSTSKEVRIINTRSPGERPETVEEQFYTEITEVKAYPNPAFDYVNTEVVLNQADRVQIRLVNMNGQVLSHYDMRESQVYYQRINVNGLSPGYYFIYVTSGADSAVHKVSVIR